MRVFIDYQANSNRNRKYRVRIISKNKVHEKIIGYFLTISEAVEVKRIVDKTIKILESI